MMVRHKAQNVAAKPRTGDIQVSEDTDFQSMLLPQPILEGLKKSGYIKPSPIQKKALPLVRCGLDLIVQAKAGTGKTCVFTVAVLELVKPSLPHLQAIVLAPTREIALQITGVICAIGQCVEGLKTACFIGGYPLSHDVEKVKGCHIAVGAPGRLKHLLEKGLLNPRHVRLFVLDEADKLMEKLFINDIDAIFAQLPDSKQVLACSATYTDRLVEFLSNYMNSGQYVSPHQTVGPTVLLGVRQFVSVIPRHVDRLAQLKLKENHLLYLLRSISFNQCLVFSNLHTRAVSLCNLLRGEGWGVEWIAGRQGQKDRVAALTQLRDQRVRVLVTTDLTARGIDVENVNLVINLDLPMDHNTYLHRMGRAGRYGSHGIVITVVSNGQELTAFQKLIGMIGGTAQSVNRVPKNLKNVDLWIMSDDTFEKIGGIVEKKKSSVSNSEESGDSTSSGEKYSPDSDSEGYVKECKGDNGTLESSDSEDYVKEYKGENGSGQINGAVGSIGMVSGTSTRYQGASDVENSELFSGKSVENNSVTSDKADDSTSTDEKFSRDSSDGEVFTNDCDEGEPCTSELSCKCNLYEADAADIKVIAGPSLFALKKEDYWRDVLPVIVNESKVPLSTPIALLDSKLIRIRFWDKTQRLANDNKVNIPSKQVINFDTKGEDKDFPSFNDIVSYLENGISIDNPIESISESTDRDLLSFENIEKALESGLCEIDKRTIAKSKEIEQVLLKYNMIKEKSETALISFDSFDLVGWLAVDVLHNIIEELSIDKCEVYVFNLVYCPAGKNHIEVLSPPKGSSKEAYDYIDHITTLNVESFSLPTPFSLSNIAQKLAHVPNNIDTQGKPGNNKVSKPTYTERRVHDISHDTAMKNVSINPLKVPTVNNKKCTAKKDLEYKSSNENPSSSVKCAASASKRNNQAKCSHVGSTHNGYNNRKNERKALPGCSTSHKDQVSKYVKETINDSENVENVQASLTGKEQYEVSSDTGNSNDSGPYVGMTRNPLMNISGMANKKLVSSGSNIDQQSKFPLDDKPKINRQCESNGQDINKHHNDYEHTQKHRNSDDNYDSFDTVEYETTDLDKKLYHRMLNEDGTQRKHYYTKHQDSTSGFKLHNPKSTKSKALYSKERVKSHDFRKKQDQKESLDTYSSIESESSKPYPKSLPKVPVKSKNKYWQENGHNTLHKDTQESCKESYDSYDSIDSDISKLRKLNAKLQKQDKVKRKHHNDNRHNRVHKGLEDYSSVGSGGTNRHSFRTACSQHLSEDSDETSNSNSRSNRCYEHDFGLPVHTHHSQHRFAKFLGTGEFDNHYFERRERRENKFPLGKDFSQNVHDPHGSSECNQFETYENSGFQNQHQDFSNLPGVGPSQLLRGENLHQEWYSNWYLRVRQRAMQLAMMEYTNNMSTM